MKHDCWRALLTNQRQLCNLEVAVDKLSVRYIGAAQPPHEAGAIKANRPFPRNVRVAYFEVTIISRGASG